MNFLMSYAVTPSRMLKAVLYTNAALFIISLVFSGKSMHTGFNPFHALSPAMDVLVFMGASGRLPIEKYQAWESLITANWLHGSLLHIVFNMLALKTVAPLVMAEYGVFRMFTIYTISGAAGFLLSFMGHVPVTIGASAGLCGLIGALLYFGRSRGGPWGQRVYQQTSGWIISLAVIGFLLPNINNWGHGGGLLGGMAMGWILGYNDKRAEGSIDQILAVCLMGITGLLLARPVIQGFLLVFT
ncbi:MAG: rhomboid family intramembrane serine protease [Desulfotignum sp.]|nr:rhomboid family intramembrane serine protease [Desulfotignum sp.]MCF8112757.1 rhomboid family intramembrane serine protease [Desulfotignum sp.]MCF8125136.1 rhomboid family intramembrane serine protease [Desulfotignum sp.]